MAVYWPHMADLPFKSIKPSPIVTIKNGKSNRMLLRMMHLVSTGVDSILCDSHLIVNQIRVNSSAVIRIKIYKFETVKGSKPSY